MYRPDVCDTVVAKWLCEVHVVVVTPASVWCVYAYVWEATWWCRSVCGGRRVAVLEATWWCGRVCVGVGGYVVVWEGMCMWCVGGDVVVWEGVWWCVRRRGGVRGDVVVWEGVWRCGRVCGGVGGNVVV